MLTPTPRRKVPWGWEEAPPPGALPAGSAGALGGPQSPELPPGDGSAERGSLGRALGVGGPLHSAFRPLVLLAQWPGGPCTAGWAPQGPRSGRGPETLSHARRRTHTQRQRLPVCPPGPGLRPGLPAPAGGGTPRAAQWAGAHSHIGGGPACGRGPFTSAGPHRWVGPGAAGRGRTRSRPLRSRSWGCPGRLVSTARRAPTGPGTPAGGRQSVPREPRPPPQPPQRREQGQHSHRWTSP